MRVGLVSLAFAIGWGSIGCSEDPAPNAGQRKDAGVLDLGVQMWRDADPAEDATGSSTTADGGDRDDGGAGDPDAGPNGGDASEDGGGGGGGNDGGGGGGNDGGGGGGNDGGLGFDIGLYDSGTGRGDAATPLAVMPSFVSVPLDTTVSFTLTSAPGITPIWTVSGVAGGNATVGTITPDLVDARIAVYAAPTQAVPVPATHTIEAHVPGGLGTAIVTLVAAEPRITGVLPQSADEGSPGVTLTITGSGFAGSTVVELDGVTLQSTALSWTSLEAMVPASLLTVAGERRLIVRNPPPGGGIAAVTFPIVLRRVIVGTGVPAGVPALFDNAGQGMTPGRLPSITYPEDGAVAPLDFPAPVVSWDLPAPGNTCRLRMRANAVLVDVYMTTIGGLPPRANPSATVDAALWSTLAQTSLGRLDLELRVACAEVVTTGGSPALADGMIYESPPVTYRVARDVSSGRVVYFSGLVSGLWRIDIGGANAVGRPWIGPAAAFPFQTPSCVGCHSFTADGTKMSYAREAPEWALGTVGIVAETPTTAVDPTMGGEAVWTAMHPSGNWVLATNLTAELVLLDGLTGQSVMTVSTGTAGMNATQAFWSPRGDQFAFVTGVEAQNGVSDFANAQIWTMAFSDTGGTPAFGPPVLLAGPDTPGGLAYYPAYSPNGEYVVFCRAPSGSSYNNPNGSLWLVKADRSYGPVQLASANRTGAIYNSWPRWSPSVSNGRYWIVFSSQRPYPPLQGTGPQQLWVSRIDVSQGATDPSSPAIWLPGQEPFTGNLTAEWTVAR